MSWSLPEGTAASGVSFGSFGELLQGALPDGEDFLVTLPIERHAVAHFYRSDESETLEVCPRWKTKSQRLAQSLLRKYGESGGGQLFLASEIPCGKGLSSSSADLVATARAIEAHLGFELPVDELCRSLSEVEPTDGVMFSESVAYFHVKGALLERLGFLPQVEVLSLDEGGQIETLEYHRRGAAHYSLEEKRRFREMLDRIRRGFQRGDLHAVGEVSTTSAYVNQRFNRKKYLDLMHAVCEQTGGAGLITTHSGTCLGILYDRTEADHAARCERAQAELRPYGQVEVYTALKAPMRPPSTLDWSSFDRT
ncbi:hypothetical protein OV090_46420 [Nannocystis sp. RBIL2]|uniref:GHMP family kinase ATP-binding protein n=1 Tax=Nannocystis sp. RBIL2 TaxID=2996788 RepID=UPI002270CCE1|nr:hypothetical protein [Nannocystis sp. RBIL2]